MSRLHKFILGGAVAILLASVGFFSCVPSRQRRSDALATAAKKAILDTDREYATALNNKPAYHGYVLRGDFDFQDVVARIGKIGPSILAENQIHAVDWRKEQGGSGFGPQYIHRRDDTDQEVLVMTVTMIACWRYGAKVQVEHSFGRETYTLARWPEQPWQVKHVESVRIVY